MPKFQLKLSDKWEDFNHCEGEKILKAFMAGEKSAHFSSRGQDYCVEFPKMVQRNVKTGKTREVRIVYDDDQKPSKPSVMPQPMAAQALYQPPPAAMPVVQATAVAPASSPMYTPGPAYSAYDGRPVAASPAYATPMPSASPTVIVVESPHHHGHHHHHHHHEQPMYGGQMYGPGPAYGGPGYMAGPSYGPGPVYQSSSPGYGTGYMASSPGYGTGALLAAGAAGLMGGVILDEIFD